MTAPTINQHWIGPLRPHGPISSIPFGEEQTQSPFGSRFPGQIRVAVDVDTLPTEEGPAVQLLRELLAVRGVDALWVSESGPPTELEPEASGAVPGWIVIGPPDPDDPLSNGFVVWRSGSSTTRAGLLGQPISVASEWWADTPYAADGEKAAKAQLVTDLTLAFGARAAKRHILISRRKTYEVGGRLGRLLPQGIVDVEAACALLALHRRLSGDFSWFRSPGLAKVTRDATSFFRLAAREMLPALSPWVGDGAGAADMQGAAVHAHAIELRFARALRARDELLALLTHVPTGGVRFLVGETVEDVMVALLGAFDSIASLFNRHLNLSFESERASWRNDDFREAVQSELPSSAQWYRRDTESFAAYDLARQIRNSIHGEPIPVDLFSPPEAAGRGQLMMELPPSMDEADIRRTVLLLGGAPDTETQGRRYVHPPELVVDRIVAVAAHTIDGMVAELGVGPTQKPAVPSSISRQVAPYDEIRAAQWSLQLGLPVSMFVPPDGPRVAANIAN